MRWQIVSACGNLSERIGAVRRLTDRALAPIGGPWVRNEVLFFPELAANANPQMDWQSFFESLVLPEQR